MADTVCHACAALLQVLLGRSDAFSSRVPSRNLPRPAAADSVYSDGSVAQVKSSQAPSLAVLDGREHRLVEQKPPPSIPMADRAVVRSLVNRAHELVKSGESVMQQSTGFTPVSTNRTARSRSSLVRNIAAHFGSAPAAASNGSPTAISAAAAEMV
jgi:hypothetical protein